MPTQEDTELLALRWLLGLVHADEVDEVSRTMVSAGYELVGHGGAQRWQRKPRPRRPDPAPISGEIIVRSGC